MTTATPTVIPNPGFHLSSYTVYDRRGQSSGSYAVHLCDDCAARRRADGTMASKWSGECINGYCDDCKGGPSVSHYRFADPEPTPPAAHSATLDSPPSDALTLPCPLGCGRRVAAQGDEIHYCVIKTKIGRQVTTSREYVGTFDGQAVCFEDNYHDAELVMRDYKDGLFEQGLVDRPLPDVVHARPAEPAAELLYACSCMSEPLACHCGAPIAYFVRESQRGHETIHRVCDDCYQREFLCNDENSDAWELLYCAHCTAPATTQVEGIRLCVACEMAAYARMVRAVRGPTCLSCGDIVDQVASLCEACQEAGEPWPDPLAGALADDPNARRQLVFCDVCGKPGTTTDPDEDWICDDCRGRRALVERQNGAALWGEFHDDPIAFLTLLGTFGDRARDVVNRAVASYLECPVGEVVGIWGESRARAVRRGMLEHNEAPV